MVASPLYRANMNTTSPSPTPQTQIEDDQEQRPKRIAGWKVIAATLGALAAIFGISLLASIGDSEGPNYKVSNVQLDVSAGGRLDVAFTVTNTGDEYGTPSCTVRAEDVDGFRVGSDIVTGQVGVAPGQRDRYQGTTGIDAADVARATVECD